MPEFLGLSLLLCCVPMQKRKAVDVWSFVKSPYGLMIVFSLFIILVLPRMKVRQPENCYNPLIARCKWVLRCHILSWVQG